MNFSGSDTGARCHVGMSTPWRSVHPSMCTWMEWVDIDIARTNIAMEYPAVECSTMNFQTLNQHGPGMNAPCKELLTFHAIKNRLEELKDASALYDGLPCVKAKQPLFLPGFLFGPVWRARGWTRLELYSAETSLKSAGRVKALQHLRLVVS